MRYCCCKKKLIKVEESQGAWLSILASLYSTFYLVVILAISFTFVRPDQTVCTCYFCHTTCLFFTWENLGKQSLQEMHALGSLPVAYHVTGVGWLSRVCTCKQLLWTLTAFTLYSLRKHSPIARPHSLTRFTLAPHNVAIHTLPCVYNTFNPSFLQQCKKWQAHCSASGSDGQRLTCTAKQLVPVLVGLSELAWFETRDSRASCI